MTTEGFSHRGREDELLRHIADVIVEIGVDGLVLFVSDSIERILARPASAFVGLSLLEIIVPEDRDATLAQFQKVVETGAEPIVRFRILRRDGLGIQFETCLRSFEVDGHRRIVASCRDVTQQSAAGAVDGERNAHYRAIVESGSRQAAIVSPSGEILFSNHRFKETFGPRVTLADIASRADAETRAATASRCFGTGQPDWPPSGSSDFEYTESDGSVSCYAVRWDGYQTERGERLFSIIFQDITRGKRVERALRTIAAGMFIDGQETLKATAEMMAQALEMDRFVVATLDPNRPREPQVLVALHDGEFLDLERLAVAGLPDEAVLEGNACIHPAGLTQLMPSMIERLGHDFESFAGLPLRRADGTPLGLVGGYSRRAILDTKLTRSLLSAFSTHASAAIEANQGTAGGRADPELLDALMLHSGDIVAEVEAEADGRIVFVSQAVERVLGFEPHALLGTSIESLAHPDDLKAAKSAPEEFLSSEASPKLTLRSRHADGSWRWLEATAHPFTASDGSPHALVQARDVTATRRTELTRDLLNRVVHEGGLMLLVCDLDTIVHFSNSTTAGHLSTIGEAPAEGRSLCELLTEAAADRLENEIIPALQPTVPWSGDLQLRGPADGYPITAEATIFLFHGAEASAHSFLAVTLRDISARRGAEEALRESELQLSQAQKMEAVGRLAGGIAHDFNNLLTAIIGYSDLLLDELNPEHTARHDAQEILRAAERAGGLTRQLLTFSRRQILQPESIDLNAVVADIDRMMRRLIGESIELVTLQDGELRPVIADPGQVEQLIVNLIVNARDAMPQGGRLEIETANFVADRPIQVESGRLEPGRYVLLRVSDDGSGMDEATRSQIFEPFFTTKKVHQGTGLGLATVYGIVSQSGGQIDVQTSLDVGTTFTVYMPEAETDWIESAPEHGEFKARGDETILLVEDSDSVRRLVQRTLESNGYKVLAAASATAALRHCSRHEGPIELLLTDVVLPKMSGPQVAERTRELRPNIRVLFMSGFTDDTLLQHGLANDEADLLEKPFTPAALLSRVHALLDSESRGTQTTAGAQAS